MEKNKLEEVLLNSLAMEEKGHKFYSEAAQKSESDITKKTFEFLADAELAHIDNIKKFYDVFREKGEFPPIAMDDVTMHKRLNDLQIFSQSTGSLKEKIRQSDNYKKALEFAMDFENIGYKYYENILKGAKDGKLTALLNFLLKEESRHHDLLSGAYSYVTDSDNWLMYEEDSFPQGG